MTQEAYCSYEVSRLLKEKGFDGASLAYYSEFDDWKILRLWRKRPRIINNTFYLCAPTQQMALAWLREEKGIYISMRLNAFAESKDELGGYWWFADILDANKGEWIDNGINKVGYEKAVEAALKYTLENLI